MKSWYRQYKQAFMATPDAPEAPEDPYMITNDMLMNTLKGSFSINFDGNDYKVYWKGCASKLCVVDYSMSDEVYTANRSVIENKARSESEKYFKEAMSGLMGQ